MQRGPVVNARWFAGIPIAALLGIGPLGAADLPLKKTIVVAQAWSWTGLYGGFHTGLGLGMAEFSNPYSDFGTIIYGNNVPSPAALIGGQVGYNYQVGRWVTGIEADASWLSSDGTNTCFAVSGLFLSSTCRVQSDFLGTVTARVGLAAGPQGQTLFYGKGGAAFMHQDIHVVRNAGVAGPGLANLTNQPLFSSGVDLGTDTMRVGWTAGVGVEQAVTPAWSLKFEYDYQRFSGRDAVTPETSNLVSLGPPDAPFATFQVVPARTTEHPTGFPHLQSRGELQDWRKFIGHMGAAGRPSRISDQSCSGNHGLEPGVGVRSWSTLLVQHRSVPPGCWCNRHQPGSG